MNDQSSGHSNLRLEQYRVVQPNSGDYYLQFFSRSLRDFATAWNILSRGLSKLGVGHSEGTSPEIEDFWCANESYSDSLTPVETALPAGTAVIPAKRVVEPGSPCLKEPAKAASR